MRALLGRLQAAGGAVEEAHAEVALELGDAGGGDGGGDALVAAGGGHGAELEDADEGAEVGDVGHARDASIFRGNAKLLGDLRDLRGRAISATLARSAKGRQRMYEFAIIWDWLAFAVRWLHVITGIAWIGSSFYFIALDLGLKKVPHLPPGAYGEEWQVHGGGFYHIQKYLVAPERMPEHLVWFKWESYATWLSGSPCWRSSITRGRICSWWTGRCSTSRPGRRS